MPRLTDTHLVILSAAAQRRDAAALPLPTSPKINKGAATSALKSLVKRGLLAERPASKDDEAWRETEGGRRVMLAITTAGLAARGHNLDLDFDFVDRLELVRGDVHAACPQHWQ